MQARDLYCRLLACYDVFSADRVTLCSAMVSGGHFATGRTVTVTVTLLTWLPGPARLTFSAGGAGTQRHLAVARTILGLAGTALQQHHQQQ